MDKCMVTSCDNNTGFGDCMYPDIKECNTRDQSNMRKVYEQGTADAIAELLKSICIGCAYLNGTKCENKFGCPCVISQAEVLRKANKALEQLKGETE